MTLKYSSFFGMICFPSYLLLDCMEQTFLFFSTSYVALLNCLSALIFPSPLKIREFIRVQ